MLPPGTNLRSLWIQYEGLVFGVAVRVQSGISPHTIHRVLTGMKVRVESWKLRRIEDATNKVARIGGIEEDLLRSYLLFLNTKQLGVSLSAVSRVAHGKTKSQRIERALAAEGLRIEITLTEARQ